MKLHEGGTLEGLGAPLSVVGTWSAGCQQLWPQTWSPEEIEQRRATIDAHAFHQEYQLKKALIESFENAARCDYCQLWYAPRIHPRTGTLLRGSRCACPPAWARNRAERQNQERDFQRTPDGRIWGPGARWKPLDRGPR